MGFGIITKNKNIKKKKKKKKKNVTWIQTDLQST